MYAIIALIFKLNKYMDITPTISKDVNYINGYLTGGFIINNIRYYSNIILSDKFLSNWEMDNFHDISYENLETIISLIPNHQEETILLIGTGKNHALLPNKFTFKLREHNIKVDTMKTDAACRTYNILLAENRKVFAALLKI